MGVTSAQQQQHLDLFHSLWWGGDSASLEMQLALYKFQRSTSPHIQHLSLASEAKGCRKTGRNWKQSVLFFSAQADPEDSTQCLWISQDLCTGPQLSSHNKSPAVTRARNVLLVLVSVFPRPFPGGWKRPVSTEVRPPDAQDTSRMRMFSTGSFSSRDHANLGEKQTEKCAKCENCIL